MRQISPSHAIVYRRPQSEQVNGGGGTDKFRIKITKDGNVIHGNLLGALDDASNAQVLAGGSIVIDSK